MTRKERLWAVHKGEDPDRIPVKLWALTKNQKLLHPDYQRIYDLAIEKTDLFGSTGFPFNIYHGTKTENVYSGRVEKHSDDWNAHITVMHTPGGDLQSTYLSPTKAYAGLTTEYFIKDADDLKKILMLDYEPYPITDLSHYEDKLAEMGDTGITHIGITHPAYMLYNLMGSELLGYLLYDEPELMYEVVSVFGKRLNDHIKDIIDAGIGKYGPFVFAYVGPELFIPPLVSYDIFEKYCFDIDKKNHDIIKNAGGYVWVHCHNKVGKLIPRFADMGVDVLNPIEPPPAGDCTIEEAVEAAAGRITLEGNIEIADLLYKDKDYICNFLDNTVRVGSAYKRFILCPSTGYMEYLNPTEKFIDNLITYVNYGVELAEKYAK
ncbi:MAG: hypothetical protein FWF15_01930 [Oscillospiraceae bacterium]|nr:hypothetical protein [Oscillospiraceae bacterium]